MGQNEPEGPNPVHVTIDHAADAAYIYLTSKREKGMVARTIPAPSPDGMLSLDFDARNRLIGVEVLGARALLAPELLDRAEDIAEVEADED